VTFYEKVWEVHWVPTKFGEIRSFMLQYTTNYLTTKHLEQQRGT